MVNDRCILAMKIRRTPLTLVKEPCIVLLRGSDFKIKIVSEKERENICTFSCVTWIVLCELRIHSMFYIPSQSLLSAPKEAFYAHS